MPAERWPLRLTRLISFFAISLPVSHMTRAHRRLWNGDVYLLSKADVERCGGTSTTCQKATSRSLFKDDGETVLRAVVKNLVILLPNEERSACDPFGGLRPKDAGARPNHAFQHFAATRGSGSSRKRAVCEDCVVGAPGLEPGTR